MELIIRKETEKDRFATEAMTRRAFWNKFGPGCNEHLLVHTLRTSPAYLAEYSRIAEIDGEIAGAILYFKAMIRSPRGDIVIPSFGPLCADHVRKNTGIGTALLRETLPRLREDGWPGVIIFGEPGYYPKHGFVTAGSLGLTDMNGNASGSFLAYEFAPGSLRIPGGRFDENAFGIEDPLTDDALARLEAEQPYEFLAKAIRPCQWSYDNATEERDGYHLVYAVTAPRVFDGMLPDCLGELQRYGTAPYGGNAELMGRAAREETCRARYVIMAGAQPAGFLVTSVPKTAEEAQRSGCGNFLDAIWLKPEFRHRGIARDIFLRYLRQQKTDTAFRVSPGNPSRALWEGLLNAEGYRYTVCPAEDGTLACRVHRGA